MQAELWICGRSGCQTCLEQPVDIWEACLSFWQSVVEAHMPRKSMGAFTIGAHLLTNMTLQAVAIINIWRFEGLIHECAALNNPSRKPSNVAIDFYTSVTLTMFL